MEEAIDIQTAPDIPSSSEVEKSKNAYLAEMRLAIRRNSPEVCCQLAKQAGEQRSQAAIPALSLLLESHRKLHQRFQFRRTKWLWEHARLTAIASLQQIDNKSTFPVLVEALFDPLPSVRTAAQNAFIKGGKAAIPDLGSPLYRQDWSLKGMTALIATLGAIGSPKATFDLVSILHATLPLSSSRWTRQTITYPYIVLQLTIVTIWITTTLSWSGPTYSIIDAIADIFTIAVGILGGCFLGTALFLFLGIPILLPLQRIYAKRERSILANEAANALILIQDKRALLPLLSTAFGASALRQSLFPKKAAQRVVLSLLPLLNHQDYGTLSPFQLQWLFRLLFHPRPYIVLRVLRAMEYVGTSQAIPPIQRLLKRGKTPNIRSEAERILSILQERQHQEQAPTFLLRASAMPQTPSEQLLRPAQETRETPPEQLLRPLL